MEGTQHRPRRSTTLLPYYSTTQGSGWLFNTLLSLDTFTLFSLFRTYATSVLLLLQVEEEYYYTHSHTLGPQAAPRSSPLFTYSLVIHPNIFDYPKPNMMHSNTLDIC